MALSNAVISLLLFRAVFAAPGEEVSLTFEAETFERRRALEGAGASGEQGARLDPSIPQWGWATVACGWYDGAKLSGREFRRRKR